MYKDGIEEEMASKTKTMKVCGHRANAGSPDSWWIDTGIFVTPANQLRIDAANPGGVIKPWPSHQGFGPAGDVNNIANRDWAETLANRTGIQAGDTSCWFGSLIGKIGRDGKAFSIGQLKQFTPSMSGTLFLAFNDGVSFEDNSGSWNVAVTFEDRVQLATSGYGTDKIFADRINTSLVDTWGVILTIQEDVTDTSLAWNPTAIANLVSAFTAVEGRLQNRADRTFKQVFGGLEIRFWAGSGAGVTHTEGKLIRFGTGTRGTTATRLDNRSWGRINPIAQFNYYPSSIPYGFFNAGDKGIQNTIMHELGHVLDFRSTSMDAAGTQFGLKVVKDTTSPTVDSSLDIGTFWENPTTPLGEILADNFLNWVRNSYVGIENNVDTYNVSANAEQRRVMAYWIGNIQYTLPGTSTVVTSPGITGFTADATSVSNGAAALLRSLGLGEGDPNCTF
jgi:hypothetical protein